MGRHQLSELIPGKDIIPKTTHLFVKSSYELHLTLWSFFLGVKFPGDFQWTNHRNTGQSPLPELSFWQRYQANNHLVFLKVL